MLEQFMIEQTAALGESRRYATVSIILHWTIAVLIVVNIALGVTARDAHPHVQPVILGYHESIGLTVLILSILRLVWRILNPMRALPESMSRWERGLARAVHAGFYIIMIGMPLTGWLAVSSSLVGSPIHYFGVATWPFFPLVRGLPAGQLARVHLGVSLTHSTLGKITLGLLALHVAGALKHMATRDGIAWRMAPIGIFLPRRPDRENGVRPRI
jgi:cytochrome b561